VQSTQGRRLFPIRPKPTNLQMRLLCRQPRDRRAPDARREIQLDSLLGKTHPEAPLGGTRCRDIFPDRVFRGNPVHDPQPRVGAPDFTPHRAYLPARHILYRRVTRRRPREAHRACQSPAFPLRFVRSLLGMWRWNGSRTRERSVGFFLRATRATIGTRHDQDGRTFKALGDPGDVLVCVAGVVWMVGDAGGQHEEAAVPHKTKWKRKRTSRRKQKAHPPGVGCGRPHARRRSTRHVFSPAFYPSHPCFST